MQNLKQWVIVAVSILTGLFIVAHVVRSIWLGKGLSKDTMKMYLVAFLAAIVALLSLEGTLPSDASIALLGAVIGYAVGGKFDGEQS
jgi:hypothetical protein